MIYNVSVYDTAAVRTIHFARTIASSRRRRRLSPFPFDSATDGLYRTNPLNFVSAQVTSVDKLYIIYIVNEHDVFRPHLQPQDQHTLISYSYILHNT